MLKPEFPKKELEKVKRGKNHPMVKWFVLAAAVGVAFGLYKMVHWFSTDAANLSGGKPASGSVSGVAPVAVSGSPAPTFKAYEVVNENRKAWMKGYMKTEAGLYRVGEVGPHGMVLSMRGYTAKCEGPDGKITFVVGVDYVVPEGKPVAAPTPAVQFRHHLEQTELDRSYFQGRK